MLDVSSNKLRNRSDRREALFLTVSRPPQFAVPHYEDGENDPMKDLILSYATNCRFEDFYRFVKSVRRHCRPEDVDIVVFLDAQGPKLSALAIEEKVTLVPVANVWNMCQNFETTQLPVLIMDHVAEISFVGTATSSSRFFSVPSPSRRGRLDSPSSGAMAGLPRLPRGELGISPCDDLGPARRRFPSVSIFRAG